MRLYTLYRGKIIIVCAVLATLLLIFKYLILTNNYVYLDLEVHDSNKINKEFILSSSSAVNEQSEMEGEQPAKVSKVWLKPEVLDNNASRVTSVKKIKKEGKILKITKYSSNQDYNIMFLFNNAEENNVLQDSFARCVNSLLRKSSQDLHFHIVGDYNSFIIARDHLQQLNHGKVQEVIHHDKNTLQDHVLRTISNVHKQLSAKNHQFSDPVFYISIVLHRIMPFNISKIILLDIDLVFKSDIADLFTLFHYFDKEQAIGIARENQPVYRNVFWEYRSNHPKSRIGDPPPFGLTGFNSGVVLLDLDKLRTSSKYNSYFTENVLLTRVKKYKFKGHLGDQDFFTLLSFENEELFFILPCGWNRQLCTWWRRDEFVKDFDLYFNCSGPINVWHGNCQTSLLNYTFSDR